MVVLVAFRAVTIGPLAWRDRQDAACFLAAGAMPTLPGLDFLMAR